MTRLPASVYTNELTKYLDEIGNNLCNDGIPIADSYYALLVRAQGTLTALQADFNYFPLTSQIPSLNIQTKVKPPLPMPSPLPMTNKPMTLAKREPQKQRKILCAYYAETPI